MRPRTFEFVELEGPLDSLPLQSRQSTARASNAVQFSLLSVLAAAIIVPQVAIVAYAIMSPSLRAIIVEQPMITLQLAVALIVWIALFAWPLSTLFMRLTGRRRVEITSSNVVVTDKLAFRHSNWTAPLSAYQGIAHHVRSSLSGNRHELVLVHPDARQSVLLLVADRISDTDIARMTTLLRLPQVPASELYRLWASSDAAQRSSIAGASGQPAWEPAAA